jgi:branched-chain amino acid transport system substrate-binding protein
MGACLLALGVSACSQPYQASYNQREKRAELAQKEKKDIVVGIVWPYHAQPSFVQGVNLAVQEINATDFDGDGVKGVLNRHLTTLVVDEFASQPGYLSRKQRNLDQLLALQTARKFTYNLDVVAVIGHAMPPEAIAASVIYQQYGILFFAPAATNLLLTQPGFKLVFRLIPPNQEQAEQLAGYCAMTKNYKNIVILHERTAYGEELADSFNETAAALGMTITYRKSFFKERSDFKSVIADLQGKKFDAVFLAVSEDTTATAIIQQLRKMINAPFDLVGSHFMNMPSIGEEAGKAAEGLVVPAVFNPTFNLASKFVEKYKLTHNGEDPDAWAAQGYDSIKLLAHGMQESGSTVPMVVATTLRYMHTWIGVTGVHAFTESGEILGKKYFFRQWKMAHAENPLSKEAHVAKGHFDALEGAHIPYSFYSLAHKRTTVDNNH